MCDSNPESTSNFLVREGGTSKIDLFLVALKNNDKFDVAINQSIIHKKNKLEISKTTTQISMDSIKHTYDSENDAYVVPRELMIETMENLEEDNKKLKVKLNESSRQGNDATIQYLGEKTKNLFCEEKVEKLKAENQDLQLRAPYPVEYYDYIIATLQEEVAELKAKNKINSEEIKKLEGLREIIRTELGCEPDPTHETILVAIVELKKKAGLGGRVWGITKQSHAEWMAWKDPDSDSDSDSAFSLNTSDEDPTPLDEVINPSNYKESDADLWELGGGKWENPNETEDGEIHGF